MSFRKLFSLRFAVGNAQRATTLRCTISHMRCFHERDEWRERATFRSFTHRFAENQFRAIAFNNILFFFVQNASLMLIELLEKQVLGKIEMNEGMIYFPCVVERKHVIGKKGLNENACNNSTKMSSETLSKTRIDSDTSVSHLMCFQSICLLIERVFFRIVDRIERCCSGDESGFLHI
jgi:hypothetical protein